MEIMIAKDCGTERIDFCVNGRAYHTNDEGYGLWSGFDYAHQIEGTAQFSLAGKSIRMVAKAIEKHFKDTEC